MNENTEVSTQLSLPPQNTTTLNAKKYPLLSLYSIPHDNKKLMSALLCKIMNFKRDSDGSLNDMIPKNSIKVHNPSNPNIKHLYIQMTNSISKSSTQNFHHSIKNLIEWRARTNNQPLELGYRDTIFSLENASPTSFLEVARERGYTNAKSPKMSAVFWIAMSEAANLRVGQQRAILQFLTYHLGKCVAVAEHEIREVGSDYVPFDSKDVVVDPKEYK
eukprot:CAMPEP_0184872852 /NCGR_PEP_ID=MMETSP0580-20130426/41520_1 /TAXON_ID=1118495 /ORGANISM="Dactyliosolen fragilissimus" /LENGTH=217 /DNA_ID=CAMNT_0027375699 /DNA_START=754 /DNA_END=1407 /DNA_ORIENTATION=-